MTETGLRMMGVLIAALGGAAIGVKRERSGHATGPAARFAGVRTFTLLGGLAGILVNTIFKLVLATLLSRMPFRLTATVSLAAMAAASALALLWGRV